MASQFFLYVMVRKVTFLVEKVVNLYGNEENDKIYLFLNMIFSLSIACLV